ncbi:MAG: hypothetical protein MI974_27870 [Chitinophagales bacterium]|nr:hypothetical protein [Chitinophagales bacterium]
MDIQAIETGGEIPFAGLNEMHLNHFKQSGFVLSGEIHTVWPSEYLRFEFLQFLNGCNGTNVLLLEESISNGYLVNKYLETGDSSYLNKVYKEFKKTVSNKRNKIRKEKLKKVHQLNSELPDSLKIKIIALDIERQGIAGVLIVLKELQKNQSAGKLINDLAEQFIDLLEKNGANRNLKNEINSFFNSRKTQAQLSRTQNYFDFILNGIIRGVHFEYNKKPYQKRDKFMFERFKEYHGLNERKGRERYFFFFFLNHLKTKGTRFANLVLREANTQVFNDPILIQYEYFGFEKNIYGKRFKKGETSRLKFSDDKLKILLGKPHFGLIRLKDCNPNSLIDYSLILNNKRR